MQSASQPAAVSAVAEAVSQALVGAGFGLACSGVAYAQASDEAASAESAGRQIEEVVVREQQRDRYRAGDSDLNKLTESLQDTPQSITTLSSELLDDRGITSLNDALRMVPGITLGAGEFSWQGNNPTIRGFNSRDDMYLDGIRDFGSYPRDPFNLETLEVLLGPSSVLFGRGSTGGAINQVSKQPGLEPITAVSVNVGSDETFRGTVDMARPIPLIGDGAAFRINVLAHDGEVADRDGAKAERFGIAPSLAVGLGSATQLTVSYMKQSADDRPDYGLPWLHGQPAPVPRNNYYGFDSDYLETDADIGTLRLEHELSNSIDLFAQARYAQYERQSRITEPLITDSPPPGTPPNDISVFRYVFFGDSEESLLTGQLGATLDLTTGNIEHTVVTGFEYSRETSEPVFAFGIGAPGTNLLNPSPGDAFSATTTEPRVIADTTAKTLAFYALDTIELSETLQLTIGARWDQFDASYFAERFAGPPTPFNAGDVAGQESFDQVDEEFSYRAALIYRVTPATNLYVAGSTSFNPSAQSLSFLTSGRGLGVGNALLDPEENRSIEIGAKSELRDGALSITGALFEITKTNARVPDPNNPGFNTLGGEQRIRGLSVDANGMLGERLYLSAGYTFLDGEVVKAAPGAAAGAELANAPEHSFSLWLNYLISERLDFGFGARYVSEQLAQNTGDGKSVPSYSIFDAMARYRVSDTITLKLNIANLADEFYFDQLHPWHVVPGPGQTATLAVNFVY